MRRQRADAPSVVPCRRAHCCHCRCRCMHAALATASLVVVLICTLRNALHLSPTSLVQEQPYRKVMAPEVHDQVEAFLDKLRALSEGATLPFVLTLEDPTGNSFVENVFAPKVGHCWPC